MSRGIMAFSSHMERHSNVASAARKKVMYCTCICHGQYICQSSKDVLTNPNETVSAFNVCAFSFVAPHAHMQI